MKTRFALDDISSLNKALKVHNVTMVVRSAFKEDDKCYLQTLLDEFLYEL